MTKLEFIIALRDKLSSYSDIEVLERINFYTEMIEDRIEDGLSEEEAVADIGSVEDIAEQIKSELGSNTERTLNPEAKPKRKLSALEITLLIIGAPIWGSLLIAAFAIAISLLASAFAIVISMWAVFVSLLASGIGCIICGAAIAIATNPLSGLATVGGGITCLGLSVFVFYGCKALTGLTAALPIKIYRSFKKEK